MSAQIDRSGFLEGVARIIEVPSVAFEEDFHAAPMWGSLACFALSLWFKREYGAALSFAEIDSARNAGELLEKVQCRRTS